MTMSMKKTRSLLGGHQAHGRGHHGHHQPHQRQQHQARQSLGQRAGRDGEHHHDESENEIRAAPTGYLPAVDDYEYEEDLAGYNADQAGTRNDDLAGYGGDLSSYEDGAGAEERGQAQYDDEQEQYEDDQYQYEEASGAEEEAAATDLDRSVDESYGAPATASATNIDNSYAAPDAARAADDGYGAPGEGLGDGLTVPEEVAPRDVDGDYSAPTEEQDQSHEADDGYAAPTVTESDYSAPRGADEEYGAPGQYEGSQGGFPFAIVEGRQGAEAGAADGDDGGEDTKVCPGGSLDICVSVCPGITARVYGACVQGCAHRCRQ